MSNSRNFNGDNDNFTNPVLFAERIASIAAMRASNYFLDENQAMCEALRPKYNEACKIASESCERFFSPKNNKKCVIHYNNISYTGNAEELANALLARIEMIEANMQGRSRPNSPLSPQRHTGANYHSPATSPNTQRRMTFGVNTSDGVISTTLREMIAQIEASPLQSFREAEENKNLQNENAR